MSAQPPFDVAIIGAGPGGYVAAIRASQLGLKAAVIERDSRFGGTCTLRGCIPTKALLHTAEIFDECQQADKLGISIEGLKLDVARIHKRKNAVVKKLSKGV